MSEKKKLFIVDDDDDDLYLFEQALKRTNKPVHLIKMAESVEAVKLLQSTAVDVPDYIFLDLNMPKKGGKECLKDIRREEHLKNVPVIIYTTTSSLDDRREVFQMGANHFMSKFSNFSDLCKTLAALLNGQLKMDAPIPAMNY